MGIRTILVGLAALVTLASASCSKSGGDGPIPDPDPTYPHKVVIQGNIPNASFKIYDKLNNQTQILDQNTADANGDTNLSFSNKEQTTTVDSIIGTADGYKKWKVVNQAIGTSKTYNVTLEELAKEFFLSGETNATDVKVYKDGTEVMSATPTNGSYETSKIQTEEDTFQADSAVYKAEGKVKQVFENIVIPAGGLVKNVTLDDLIILKGKTIDLVKSLDLPWIVTDQEFIDTRTEGNASFTIFSKDGWEKQVISGPNGNYEIILPSKGDYGVQITTSGMHPMMYLVRADETTNNEIIAMVSADKLDLYNLRQTHMRLQPSKDNPEILVANDEYSRILNTSVQLRENPDMQFLNRIINDITGELGGPINQERIDLVTQSRNDLDVYENNYFKNNPFRMVDDNSEVTNEGAFMIYYMTGSPFQGTGGGAIKNGVIVRAGVGINEKQYEGYVKHGYTVIKDIIFAEYARTTSGAFGELIGDQGAESTWKSVAGLNGNHREDSKAATILYHWHLDKFTKEGQLGEGLHPGLFDSRIGKEFSQLQIVKDHLQQYSLPAIEEKYLQ